MGTPTTQVIASWTEEAIQTTEWLSIDDAIFEAISSRIPNWSDEKKWDLVESSTTFVVKILRDRIETARQDGAAFFFEIDEEEPPYIRSTGKGNWELLGKLKRIDPYDFEKVCSKILEHSGCASEVTQKSYDGGIDFVATGLDILPDEMNCPEGVRAAIIGQAKRYSTNLIAEKALREFVGASLVRRHHLRVQKKIWPLSPVLLAFWTTSNFDPSGRRFARDAGVWLMDGPTISAVLDDLGLAKWVMSLPDEVTEGAS